MSIESREAIFNKVKEVIEQAMFVENKVFDLTSRIIDDLGAESMDIACIMMGLEDEFGGEVTQEEMATMVTVGDVVDYIYHRMDSTNQPALAVAEGIA